MHSQVMFEKSVFGRMFTDVVCHCKSETQAEMLKRVLIYRMKEVGLELHREKTKIVYYQDENRKQPYPTVSDLIFWATDSEPVGLKKQYGGYFANFSPAISKKAEKAIRQEIRRWELHLRSDKSLEELAEMYNAKIQGWINYYWRYCKSELRRILRILDGRLTRWAMREYKRLKGRRKRVAL